MFVANFEKMKEVLNGQKEKSEAGGDGEGIDKVIVEDTMNNEATMVDDALLGTGQRGGNKIHVIFG